jgi:Terminase large subunit, T4likevirus-type, N-terminal
MAMRLSPEVFAVLASPDIDELDDWQRELLWSDHPQKVVNASRQSGKSSVAAVKATRVALTEPDSLILCVSPSLRQSQELFRKCLGCYKGAGKSVPPDSETKLSLSLRNGSRIVSLPGSEAKIRGYSRPRLLLLDEASRCPSELYLSLRPMMATSENGELWLLSTPNGFDPVFHAAWEETRKDPSLWEAYEVPATVITRITPQFLERERRSMPAKVYRQEFLCAFESSDTAVFDRETIERAFDNDLLPLHIPSKVFKEREEMFLYE